MSRLEDLITLATDSEEWLENKEDSIFLRVFDWDNSQEAEDIYYLKLHNENIDIKEQCEKALKAYYTLLANGDNARLYVQAEEYEQNEKGELYATGNFYAEDCMFTACDDFEDN
jgi:hypothetical protein